MAQCPKCGAAVTKLMKGETVTLANHECSGYSRDQALRDLGELVGLDPEYAHPEADKVLLRLLNDPDVQAAWEKVSKWYS